MLLFYILYFVMASWCVFLFRFLLDNREKYSNTISRDIPLISIINYMGCYKFHSRKRNL